MPFFVTLRNNLIILFLSVSTPGFAQTNPAPVIKDFFKTLRDNDTSNFVKHYITFGELSEITKAALFDSINIDSLRYRSNVNNPEFTYYLTQKEFPKIKTQADSLQINLSKTEYVDCKYQVVKDPKYLVTSLSGAIFFKEGNNFFELKIDEAIYINDNWKITKIGNITILSDSSVLTKEHVSITPFNGLDLEIKLTDVKLEEELPPPPPPPPPPKKPKKN
jgi:hypothetical protein